MYVFLKSFFEVIFLSEVMLEKQYDIIMIDLINTWNTIKIIVVKHLCMFLFFVGSLQQLLRTMDPTREFPIDTMGPSEGNSLEKGQ